MSQYASRADLAAKVEWEGGLEGFLDYGFKAEEVPEGDVYLFTIAEEMLAARQAYRAVAVKFEMALPDPAGGEFGE